MEHRIRAAVILIEEGKILLVKHVDPQSGEEWWIPPGGGLQPEDNSIIDCARREVWEETGLEVTLAKLLYLREFHQRGSSVHHIEWFFLADSYAGELTMGNLVDTDPDAEWIQELAWLGPGEMQELVVYPEILLDRLWADLEAGFPETRYLGVHCD